MAWLLHKERTHPTSVEAPLFHYALSAPSNIYPPLTTLSNMSSENPFH